jgi:starch-binding outer membrane protein, SusD/RagB family
MRKCFKHNRWLFIVGMLLILNTVGCKKLVQVDDPDDSFTSAIVFSNDSLAQTAVTGLYIKIMTYTKYLLSGGMSVFTSLSGDELQRTSLMANEEQFYQNDINQNNVLINTNLWKAAYTYIYHCNSCIEGLYKSNGVSTRLKERLTGEVKLMRALCYYYLINLYGDVPLALGTNADVNAMLSRAPVDQVYKQIEMDLVEASDALINERVKTAPTIFSAQALLARIYLHQKKWDKAEQTANAVINSGQFALQTNLRGVFIDTSKEVIFQLAPVQANMNSPEGFVFIPIGSSKPAYTLSKDLWDAFEPGDLRRDTWIKSVTIGGQTYRYPYKYRINASSSSPTEYSVVLRLAEQYLVRAEARAMQNDLEEAVKDVNVIRRRAGLPDVLQSITKQQCLDAIAQERRTELFIEWGHRWIDLKRTGRANAVLSKVKNNWQYYDTLFPIPFSELETAPNLEQNPGYE